jgi:hypothetical protein
MKLRPLLIAGIGLMLAFVVACGGGDKSSTDVPAGSISAGSGILVSGGLDLSKAASAIEELKSFRFDLSLKMEFSGVSGNSAEDMFAALLLGALGDIKASGAYVAPDKTETTITFAGQEIGYIQIGNQAWMKMGGVWTPTTASDALGFNFGSPTDLFEDFLPQEVLKGAKTSRERVNGVDTTRFSYDKQSLLVLAEEFGAMAGDLDDIDDLKEFSLDVWVTDSGIPVKLLMNIVAEDATVERFGIKLEANIKDINSNITIRPPA